MAPEAEQIRLAPARADFHHGPEHFAPHKRPKIRLQSACIAINDHDPSALKCHVATSASRPSRPPGGALRAALTRSTRRGEEPVRDEGVAFVAGFALQERS